MILIANRHVECNKGTYIRRLKACKPEINQAQRPLEEEQKSKRRLQPIILTVS